MKRKIAAGVLIVLVWGVFVAYRLYNKPHRDPSSEMGIKVEAIKLFADFQTDEAKANNMYLDKTLEVNGVVIEISENQEQSLIIVLESGDPIFGVRCTLATSEGLPKVGESVTIKGICTGYLSDVVINSAHLVKSRN